MLANRLINIIQAIYCLDFILKIQCIESCIARTLISTILLPLIIDILSKYYEFNLIVLCLFVRVCNCRMLLIAPPGVYCVKHNNARS